MAAYATDGCSAALPDLTTGLTTNLDNLTLTQEPPAATRYTGPGTYPFTVRATDRNSNTVVCERTVVLADTTAPRLVVTGTSATVILGPSGLAVIALEAFGATATDNCTAVAPQLLLRRADSPSGASPAVRLTCDDAAANVPFIFSATDAPGNRDSLPVTVTVLDTTPPPLTCLRDTLYLDASGTADYPIGDLALLVSDNCPYTFIADDISQTYGHTDTGLISSVETRTDAAGNVATCTVELFVVDTFLTSALGYWQTVADDVLGIYPNPNGGSFTVH
ncbi:hypothetical protein [Lewinella sp. IMCC34183]|uniref:hypothetical protein n=1 Tax=Lewinella sp. IMCC34183 TaxID=2248762 RepID=UPI000E2672A8|nr:hypothetical protein [Lewinella sp. IMCC34183]